MDPIDLSTTIQERVSVLPESIQELIRYDAITITAEQAQERHSLSDEQEALLENQLAMILLLYYPPIDLPRMIKESLQIDGSRADMVARFVTEELLSIVEDEIKAFWSRLTVEEGRASQIAPEIPENQSPVSALRTMEGDVERVHGYGAYRDIHPTGDNTGATTMSSSQDDLLGNRLANTPRYTDS